MDCTVRHLPQAAASSLPRLKSHLSTPLFNPEIKIDPLFLISDKEYTPLISRIVTFWAEKEPLFTRDIKLISAATVLDPSNNKLHTQNLTVCEQSNIELQGFLATLQKTATVLWKSFGFWDRILKDPDSELSTIAAQKKADRADKFKTIESLQSHVLAISTEYNDKVKTYQNTIAEYKLSLQRESDIALAEAPAEATAAPSEVHLAARADSPVLVPKPIDTMPAPGSAPAPAPGSETQYKGIGWAAFWPFGSK